MLANAFTVLANAFFAVSLIDRYSYRSSYESHSSSSLLHTFSVSHFHTSACLFRSFVLYASGCIFTGALCMPYHFVSHSVASTITYVLLKFMFNLKLITFFVWHWYSTRFKWENLWVLFLFFYFHSKLKSYLHWLFKMIIPYLMWARALAPRERYGANKWERQRSHFNALIITIPKCYRTLIYSTTNLCGKWDKST